MTLLPIADIAKLKKNVLIFFFCFLITGAAGSEVRISCSGDSSKPPTIAEEAVDQLQENEKLVAGKLHTYQN